MLEPTPSAPDIEVEKQTIFARMVVVEPPWRVWVHNDDVTPYDFVVYVLINVFGLSPEDAEVVTWIAHNEDVALVLTAPKAIAIELINKAHFAAGLEGYPLRFTAEPET